jgi:SNF2 family DNA or RNA helicase
MNKTISAKMKKYFTQDKILEGLDLFSQSKVSSVTQKGRSIYAFVDKVTKGKHEIMITIDFDGTIMESVCDCNEKYKCAHAAAVVFYFDRFGPHKNEKYDPENPLKEKKYESYEENLNLKNDYNPSLNKSMDFFINNLSIETKDKQIPKSQYRLVLIMLREEGYYRSEKMVESKNIKVSLGCQLIKKNGEGGKIKLFSRVGEEQIADEEPEGIYRSLLGKFDNTDLLVKYACHIAENNIPVYDIDGRQELLKFIEIQKIIIDFKLIDINTGNHSGLYRPVIYSIFIMKDVEYKMDIFEYSAIKDTLIFTKQFSEVVLFKKYDEKTIKFLKVFLKTIESGYELNLSGIKKLAEFVNNNGLSQYFEVNDKKENISIVKEKPAVILELNEFAIDLKKKDIILIIRPFFKYTNGSEIQYKNLEKDNYLVCSDPEKTTLLFIDHKFYKKIFYYLSEYFESKSLIYSEDDEFMGDFNTKVLELKTSLLNFLENFGEDLIEKGFDLRLENDKTTFSSNTGRIKINVTSGIDWFDIHAEYADDTGSYDIDLTNINGRIVKINGKYTLITKENIKLLESLIKDGMDENGNLKINKNHLYIINRYYEEIENKQDDEFTRYKKIADNLKSFESIEIVEVPKMFSGELRNYQHSGFNWLCFLDKYGLNGCLADDMGLGKTVQTLCLLLKLKNENRLGNVLLVAPVTTLANWESEIKKFTPDLKFIRHVGQDRVKEDELIKENDITIVSYHTLRNDIDFFDKLEFNYLILDESQNIKNAKSQIYKAIKLVRSNHKLSLSGTPVENNTVELWALFNFLNPGLLGNQAKFVTAFATPIEKYGDKEAADHLKKIIMPFMLRRKKEDVLKDLPPKEEIINFCEMEKDQKDLYNSLKEHYKKEISDTIEKNGIEKSAIKFFEGLLRLRQCVLFPDIIKKEYENIGSAKFDFFTEIIDDIVGEGHKVLIFSQFVEVLKRIKSHIEKNKYEYSYIDGQTKNREKEIDNFQKNEKCSLFLLSLKAGGVGINLTKADYVILYDPWWNPAVESQAIDRCHRIGQKNKVIVYKMIVKDSIEEKILAMQEKKKSLVKDIISEESTFYKSLNKEDIISLFE